VGHANNGTTMHAKGLMSCAHQHSFASRVTADWTTGINDQCYESPHDVQ